MKQTKVSHSDVMLYHANILGYSRFAFSIAAMVFAYDAAQSSVIVFAVCYSISQLCDAIDGTVARTYN